MGRLWMIALSTAMACVACGSGNTAMDDTSSASRFCATFHRRLLVKAYGCERASAEAMAAGTASLPSFVCAPYDDAVATGHASYDESRVEPCLAAVDGLRCEGPAAYLLSIGEDPSTGLNPGPVWPGTIPECEAVVTGRVTLGGSCNSLLDCAEGYCDMSSTCPGTCVAYGQAGQACHREFLSFASSPGSLPAETCGAGLGCGALDPSGTGTCGELSAVGGSCPCQVGLYCDFASKACMLPKTAGPCSDVTECALGYLCVNSTCQSAPILGDSCVPTPDGALSCAPGYACDPVTRTCITALGAGQNCLRQVDGTNYHLACQDGAVLIGSDECTCPPPQKGDGQPCTSDDECVNACDPVQHRCAGKAGGPCW